MTNKKVVSLALVGLLTAGCLTGCAKNVSDMERDTGAQGTDDYVVEEPVNL